MDAATFQSISLPDLRALYGCQERLASLLSAIDSKATVRSITLDAGHGTYGTWFEGVLRCIPNQELHALSIGYAGPVADNGAGCAKTASAPSRLVSEILPQRLRRYEQSQLSYMSITLRNMTQQDAKVSLVLFENESKS